MNEDVHNYNSKTLWGKYGPAIVLTALIGYVLLLITGVIAEIFKIQSVLDWWIWSPPGSK